MTHPGKPKKTWTAAEAAARIDEVIDLARSAAAQTITRDGLPSVVVVSAEEWARKAKGHETLAEYLLKSPLRDFDLDLHQPKEHPRFLRS